jgi:hypothetical protein
MQAATQLSRVAPGEHGPALQQPRSVFQIDHAPTAKPDR